MRMVFEWPISKWNVLKSQHLLKLLWCNIWKSPHFSYIGMKLLIIRENSTKCCLSVSTSDYRFYDKFWYLKTKHCVKFVQIRSFFWSVFSCIRIEYGNLLRKTKHCMKSTQIRTSKSSVFGHFSRSESQPIFPCSTMKFMFWCLKKIYLRNELADSADWKSTKILSTNL